jgi:hypothetical protein
MIDLREMTVLVADDMENMRLAAMPHVMGIPSLRRNAGSSAILRWVPGLLLSR